MLPLAPHRFFEGGALPEAYEADGVRIALRTDFRVWLKYDWVCGNHAAITNDELVGLMYRLCCKENAVYDGDKLFNAFHWFHACGNVEQTSRLKISQTARDTMNAQPKLGCLFWDFKAIWDSFVLQYGIDLYSCGKMHWWRFVAMLGGLRSDMPYPLKRQMRGMKRHDIIHDKNTEKQRDQARAQMWDMTALEQVMSAFPERW